MIAQRFNHAEHFLIIDEPPAMAHLVLVDRLGQLHRLRGEPLIAIGELAPLPPRRRRRRFAIAATIDKRFVRSTQPLRHGVFLFVTEAQQYRFSTKLSLPIPSSGRAGPIFSAYHQQNARHKCRGKTFSPCTAYRVPRTVYRPTVIALPTRMTGTSRAPADTATEPATRRLVPLTVWKKTPSRWQSASGRATAG